MNSARFKDLALRLLSRLGNYPAAAATGVLLAGGGGEGSLYPPAALLTIAAAGLVVDAGAEHLRRDSDIERVTKLLKDLVQRHGRLEDAVAALASGREASAEIDPQRAKTLLTVLRTPPDELAKLVAGQARIESLLVYIGQWLAEQSEAQLQTLLQLIEPLPRLMEERFDRLEDKLDSLHQGQGGLTSRAPPTAEELEAAARDDEENSRLRAERLRAYMDAGDADDAVAFAAHCQVWLDREWPRIGPAHRVRLLEAMADVAISRIGDADGTDRSARVAEAVRIADRIGTQLDRLESPDRLRASSLLAYVRSREGGADAGLNLLDGRSDPWGVRRRLAILWDAGRLVEAVALVHGVEPAVEWAERAVQVFSRAGEDAEAERVLAWALRHAPAREARLARVRFVEGMILAANDTLGDGELRSLLPEWAPRFRRADAVLSPLLDTALDKSALETGFDAQVLGLGVQLADVLDAMDALAVRAAALARRRPLWLYLAELARRGRIRSAPDWPQRLRTEGPRSFDRLVTAAALEGRDPSRRAAAFAAAKLLAPDAATPGQRQQLHAMLMDIVQHLGEDEQAEFEALRTSLMDPESRQAKLWTMMRSLATGSTNISEALEATRDETDPLWLQVHGLWLVQTNRPAEGVGSLAKASLLMDAPDSIADAAGLALAHQQWATAAGLLERLLALRPFEPRVKSSLAAAYQHLERFGDASKLFLELVQDHPEEPRYVESAAGALVLAARPEEAIKVLHGLCEGECPPVEALAQLAQLLVERQRAAEGFALLRRHRERLWEHFELVGIYWTTAMAAEDEAAAHEALLQIQRLQRRGDAPADVLVERSLDDVLEMSASHQQRESERAWTLLRGRVPWLRIAEVRRQAAYAAWDRRTSKRPFILEDPVHQAESAVYATHGFAVAAEGGRPILVPLQGPPAGTPVVADLTALITLQELGVLREAAAFCGRFHIPARYLFRMFTDSGLLRPHQPSRRTALGRIRALVADGTISVQTPDDGAGGDVLTVDEYYPEDRRPEGVYHLADVRAALVRGRAISDAEAAGLAAVAKRPVTVSEGQPPLELGDTVRFEPLALATLHGCGLLERVTEEFRVVISGEHHRTLTVEAGAFERQSQLHKAHLRLWDIVRDSDLLERHPMPRGSGEPAETDREGVSALALELARELRMPLLADDRCLQAVLLSDVSGPTGAFGTAQLLAAMAQHGHIDQETFARCFRKLIDWRYRFLLLDTELLLFWARQSQAAPPGPDLQAAAGYLHACLRDPGLLGGAEQTEPPSSVAAKLWSEIETTVGDFLGALWSDRSINEPAARELTAWALSRLLPSPPLSLEPGIRRIADMPYPLLFSALLFRVSGAEDFERARRGLQFTAEVLGIDRAELIRRAVEVIDAIESADP